MATNPNMPRPHQYRVGSLVAIDDGKHVIEIENIEKLKKAPQTFAITFREIDKINTAIEQEFWKKPWCGAHQLNQMLDEGSAQILSY
jgi:hypothetical protein